MIRKPKPGHLVTLRDLVEADPTFLKRLRRGGLNQPEQAFLADVLAAQLPSKRSDQARLREHAAFMALLVEELMWRRRPRGSTRHGVRDAAYRHVEQTLGGLKYEAIKKATLALRRDPTLKALAEKQVLKWIDTFAKIGWSPLDKGT